MSKTAPEDVLGPQVLGALIFDFDGLLIDSEQAVAAAWREVFSAYDLPFPHDIWVSMVGTRENDDALWRHLVEVHGIEVGRDELEYVKRRRTNEIAQELTLLPGADELLGAASRAGLPLALASSSSGWWISGHLERLGIAERFDVVRTREHAERSKPDPGVYLAALERLGVPARTTVAFEDSEAGVRAAKAAGLRVIAVPGSFSERMDFSAADLVVDSLAEVDLLVAERVARRD